MASNFASFASSELEALRKRARDAAVAAPDAQSRAINEQRAKIDAQEYAHDSKRQYPTIEAENAALRQKIVQLEQRLAQGTLELEQMEDKLSELKKLEKDIRVYNQSLKTVMFLVGYKQPEERGQ